MVYVPSADEWFVFHDFVHLRAALQTPGDEFIRAVLDPRDGGESIIQTGKLYRPAYYLTVLAEARSFDRNPLPYRLVNVALHVANTAMVLWLARFFLGTWIGGAATAFVYATHPTLVDAVGWASSITELLLGLCVFSSLAVTLKAEEAQGIRCLVLRSVAWMLAGIGMLAREPGVAAPLLLAICHVLWHRHDWKRLRMWLGVLPAVALLAAYAGLRWPVLTAAARSVGASDVPGRVGWHVPINLLQFAGWVWAPFEPFSPWHTWAVIARGTCGILFFRMCEWAVRRLGTVGQLLVAWWLSFAILYSLPDVFIAGRYNYVLLPPALILSAMLIQRVALLRKVVFAPGTVRTALRTMVVVGLISLVSLSLMLNLLYQDRFNRFARASMEFYMQLHAEYPELPRHAVLVVKNPPEAVLFLGEPFFADPMVDLFYGVDVRVVLGQPPPGADAPVYSFVFRPR